MPVYVGEVRDDQDPEQAGRLKLRVPAIADGDLPDWISPRAPMGRILAWVPPRGELVYVERIGAQWRWHAAPVEGAVKWPGNATTDYPARVVLSGRDGAAAVVLVEGGGAYLLAGAGGAIRLATTDSAPVQPLILGDTTATAWDALLAGLQAFTAATKAAAVEPSLGPASTALELALQALPAGADLKSRVSSTE